MAYPQLARILRNAQWVCEPCGLRYGDYRAGTSTFHVGRCDVCKLTAAVTETRDFGYLRRGRVEAQDPSLNSYP